MPNRFLKETICTSEDIDKLSPQAEILFYRLIVQADDFGLYYGNEKIIKSTCYPLKSDDIKISQLKAWMDELVGTGLVLRYAADDGKIYIKLMSWEKHQQKRATKSKFPIPKEEDYICNHLISIDNNCYQALSNDNNCSELSSDSNTNTNTNTNNSNRNISLDSKSTTHAREKQKIFEKPTAEEVTEYCKIRNNGIDAEAFIDYYESVGWKIGNKPMKDWKSSVRTWERRNKENGATGKYRELGKAEGTAQKYDLPGVLRL